MAPSEPKLDLLQGTLDLMVLQTLATLGPSHGYAIATRLEQVSGGALSGAVTTGSQVAVPGARVTLKNLATGVGRVVTTDAGGLYTSANLEPGSYEMTVEASGLATQLRTNIIVTLGAKLVVNVEMELAS